MAFHAGRIGAGADHERARPRHVVVAVARNAVREPTPAETLGVRALLEELQLLFVAAPAGMGDRRGVGRGGGVRAMAPRARGCVRVARAERLAVYARLPFGELIGPLVVLRHALRVRMAPATRRRHVRAVHRRQGRRRRLDVVLAMTGGAVGCVGVAGRRELAVQAQAEERRLPNG